MLVLHDYYRSSACYRVRIALNIKALRYQINTVHLVQQGGQQYAEAYQAINPQCLVPTLEDGDFKLSQSIAIMDYLDQSYPEPALYPDEPRLKAKVKQVVLTLACDVHPLNNLRVLKYLEKTLEVEEQEKLTWYRHWIAAGFSAIEQLVSQYDGPFCFGDRCSAADICLIPQVYNALRFDCDLAAYAKIRAVNAHCLQDARFSQAAPETQAVQT